MDLTRSAEEASESSDSDDGGRRLTPMKLQEAGLDGAYDRQYMREMSRWLTMTLGMRDPTKVEYMLPVNR